MDSKITRFMRDTQYIGVNHNSRDTFGEWRREIHVVQFQGRPFGGCSAYDEVYVYTPELWNKYLVMAMKQAADTNREVVKSDHFVYLAPIWIHGVKQAEV